MNPKKLIENANNFTIVFPVVCNRLSYYFEFVLVLNERQNEKYQQKNFTFCWKLFFFYPSAIPCAAAITNSQSHNEHS